jgi:predicted kinase
VPNYPDELPPACGRAGASRRARHRQEPRLRDRTASPCAAAPPTLWKARRADGWRWRRSRICRRLPPQENLAAGRTAADPKGFVVLTIGLPGSGKTTWFKRRGVTPLSSDMLRTILFDDITEQRYQGLVFSTLRSLLRARLIARMPWNYVDATNLSPHERRQWIKMAVSFGYEVQAVFFDVPLGLPGAEREARPAGERRRDAEDVGAAEGAGV